MTVRKTNIYRQFNNEKLLSRLGSLNNTLSSNYGKDLAVTNSVFDELYEIIFFCLESKNKAALLEAAESLKLGYGLSYEAQKIRPDEYLYWREVVLASLANGEFQAVEYLVESSRNLLKIFNDERDVIVETLKIIADMAMQEKKPFIASVVFDILLYRLPRLGKENKKTAATVIGCFSSIGLSALKVGDVAFFMEINALLCQNITKIAEQEELYWDKLVQGWLQLCLKESLYESYYDWQKFFKVYRQLRPGDNPSFYAEIITIAQRFILKIEDYILQDLFADVLKFIWLRANYMECILCTQAFGEAYKKTVGIVCWEKTVFVFKPLFFFAIHIANNLEKKDKRTALRKTLLDILLPELNRAATLSLLRFSQEHPLQLLFQWREFFLEKFKNKNTQMRVKRFWLLTAENWQKNNFGQFDNDKTNEFMSQFYE